MTARVTRRRVIVGLAAAVVAAGMVTLGAGDPPPPERAGQGPAVATPSMPIAPSRSGLPLPGVSRAPAGPPSQRPPARSPADTGRRLPPRAVPPQGQPDGRPDRRPDDPPGPSPSAAGSLLQRYDPVPDGVSAQVRFFLGGDGTCLANPELTEPAITGLSDEMERPFEADICFDGFDTSRTLLVNLVDPHGLGKEMEVEKERHYDTFYQRLPPAGLVPGRWLLEARQGDAYVAQEFTVRRATTPRLWIEHQFNGRTWKAGEEIPYFVGGFAPLTTISLDLYRAEGGDYLTSFPLVVDNHGEGRGVLKTVPRDPPGCYGISHPWLYPEDPQELSFPVFCLVR